jgi:hypothetical protein
VTRLAVILATISALCLGLALGFMGGVMFSRHVLLGGSRERAGFGFEHRFPHGFRRGSGPGGMPSPRMMVAHLQRLLELSPAQADSISAEIERSRGDFAQVRDSLHARIERHLTPQQRERWRSAMREWNPDGPRGPDPRTLRAEPGREGERSR